MAPRVLLLSILFTVGLLTGQNFRAAAAAGLDLTLGFVREPQDVVAVRSRPLTLECQVFSTVGDFNVTWLHDGNPLQLPADGRRVVLANGSLYFKKVQYKRTDAQDASDAGEYRCVARNSVGALVSRPAQVFAPVLSNNFIKFPNNSEAEVGDVVHLACQIESVPKATIVWKKDGKTLPQDNRILLLDSGDLFLLDVQMTDEGTYRCMATNPVNKKKRESPEGVLTVAARTSSSQRALQFLNPSTSNIHLHQGESLLLPCAVVGPESHELTWTFTAVNSTKGTILNHTTEGVLVLSIQNLSLQHSGNYTCTATAPGLESIKKVVELNVWLPPYFNVNGTPISESYPGAKTVRFKCNASGVPKPEIIWLKDGERLHLNAGRIKLHPTEMVLLNIVTTDTGIYQCIVRNKAGEIWAAGRLQVYDSEYRPDPPHSLICSTLSSKQIHLSWESPQRTPGDKILAYTIHFVRTDAGDGRKKSESQQVQLNQTSIVDNLDPYTNYTFYIRAYNEKSASDGSNYVTCQTGEGVPTAYPIFEVQTSPSTAIVRWVPLSNEKAGGLITQYKIQWRRLGHPSSNVEEVDGDVLQYIITALQPGKQYEIRVLAGTKKGFYDDKQAWKTVTMPSYGSQNVPQAPFVNLSAVNSTCIEVSWSLSSENKYPPVKFKLFYRKRSSRQIGPIELPANTSYYILSGLEPQTLYKIYVLGVSAAGDGDMGVQSIHTWPESSLHPLEPPGNLEAEPTSPTTINLTWTPPPSIVNVAHYNVSYTPVLPHGRNEAVEQYIRGTGTGVEISNLRPFTLYEFKVRSHDYNNRYGPYSQKLECLTMEDVPSAVRDVQWMPLNSSSIRVSWKEPAQSNGNIGSYILSYTQDATLPVSEWQEHRVPGNRTSAEVVGLEAKSRYFLYLRAATHAGLGPLTSLLSFNTLASVGEPTEDPYDKKEHTNELLGIKVGFAIGVVCILICVAIILWRKRCIRAVPAAHVGSGLQHVNGNGYYRDWERPQETELEEMELHIAAMATNIPPINHNLLDTKGGYSNGQANGLKHPLLSNGRIPNGHGNRNKGSVHITENPQVRPSYKCEDPSRQLISSQESKLDEEEDRNVGDHKVPLLGKAQLCTAVSVEDHTEADEDEEDEEDEDDNEEEEEDNESRMLHNNRSANADLTQLTELEVSMGGDAIINISCSSNVDSDNSNTSSSSSSSSSSNSSSNSSSSSNNNNSSSKSNTIIGNCKDSGSINTACAVPTSCHQSSPL